MVPETELVPEPVKRISEALLRQGVLRRPRTAENSHTFKPTAVTSCG